VLEATLIYAWCGVEKNGPIKAANHHWAATSRFLGDG